MQKSGVLGLVGGAINAMFAVAKLRQARQDNDKLRLANAVAGAAMVATDIALAVRTLRKR